MANLTSIPVPADAFCSRKIGEETFFMAMQGDVIHVLDGMGSYIWEAVDGERSAEQILDLICAEFDVARTEAEDDLLRFLDDLVAKELVRLES